MGARKEARERTAAAAAPATAAAAMDEEEREKGDRDWLSATSILRGFSAVFSSWGGP